LDPIQAADLVVDAIRDERFWIFTNPELTKYWFPRFAAAAEGRNPALYVPPSE
jgi:hypothetical protein